MALKQNTQSGKHEEWQRLKKLKYMKSDTGQKAGMSQEIQYKMCDGEHEFSKIIPLTFIQIFSFFFLFPLFKI